MKQAPGPEILLVALGGNALIRKDQRGTVPEQFGNLKVPIRQVARLSRRYRIIITHGNGPQVGNLLLQQECCDAVPPLPLEILVAQTQGQIGYMIESTLDSELMALGVQSGQFLVSLISYVVVDVNDPEFPTKRRNPRCSCWCRCSVKMPIGIGCSRRSTRFSPCRCAPWPKCRTTPCCCNRWIRPGC